MAVALQDFIWDYELNNGYPRSNIFVESPAERDRELCRFFILAPICLPPAFEVRFKMIGLPVRYKRINVQPFRHHFEIIPHRNRLKAGDELFFIGLQTLVKGFEAGPQ